MKKYFAAAGGLALALATTNAAQAVDRSSWTRPTEPFRIVDNIYYVGAEGLAAYLITAGKEAILLDGTLEENAPMIKRNIAKLGFKMSDVKTIITSHAHNDHVGAVAQLKRDSGAKLYASAGDRGALEEGLHGGQTDYPRGRFPAVKVDRVLMNGDIVSLGDTRMTATMTPGHTPGCTTWSTQAMVDGQALDVVFPCSTTVAGNILVGNKRYPAIIEDFRKSFGRLAAMEADVVLTYHPTKRTLQAMKGKLKEGGPLALVDRQQLGKMTAATKAAFEAELTKALEKKR
ncbi:subclass B3 metallo-beta-lactamase [Nitratireductor luteus]|uniref:subclass B3 metallo-beta-lactamase n=1 Tax=Nitratireductor luteus TaxID=2976980 RepID=UPI00223F1763|nr:subclass B3 metallo-beta-lactamase [Nitratireductor luteus]